MGDRGRGQIVEKGERKWLVRVFLGRDPRTGKRRYHNKTIYGTKREAQKYRTQVLQELDAGTYVEQSKVTLGEFLEDWLESTVARRTSARTLNDYRSVLTRYVFPALGARKLQALQAFEIEELYRGMEKKGLSASTVRSVHAPLRSALNDAVRWSMIARNPVALVKPPKIERKERPTFSEEEAARFLGAASGTRLEALWWVLLSTGMRPGEALALKWSDLDGNCLRIQRALTRTRAGGWAMGSGKTGTSRRTVVLSREAIATLAAHRRRQVEERLRLRAEYSDQNLIFSSETGSPLDLPNLTRRHFRPLLRAADVPSLRIYDLRHTCATMLLGRGVNPKVVSEMLGHRSVIMTLDRYSHVTPTLHAEAAAVMSAALGTF